QQRSFIEYILRPLAQVIMQCVSNDTKGLRTTLSAMKHPSSHLSAAKWTKLDIGERLCRALGEWMPLEAALADTLVGLEPTPLPAPYPSATAPLAVCSLWAEATGPEQVDLAVRVLSGTLSLGDTLTVVSGTSGGVTSSAASGSVISVTHIAMPGISPALPHALPGAVVILRQVAGGALPPGARCFLRREGEEAEEADATEGEGFECARMLAEAAQLSSLNRFHLPDMALTPYLSVDVVCLRPTDNAHMVAALSLAGLCRPQLSVSVSSTDVFTLVGLGEVGLDTALHDIRRVYAQELRIRVSDTRPVVREIVTQQSKVVSARGDGLELRLLAMPVHEDVCHTASQALLTDSAHVHQAVASDDSLLKADALSTIGISAIEAACTVAVNESVCLCSVDGVEDKHMAPPATVRGFNWACRAGPATGSPLYGVMIRVLSRKGDPLPAVEIPVVRSAVNKALLGARVRLLEPELGVEVITPAPDAVKEALDHRRGVVIQKRAIPCTPLYAVLGVCPATDAIGLATEIRVLAGGQADVSVSMSGWRQVPGDPMLDSGLPPLEVAPTSALGCDLGAKLRMQRGIELREEEEEEEEEEESDEETMSESDFESSEDSDEISDARR
ncbi:hypothetical protein KIPB_011843, partial [Kipferlia bialata]